jgi:hypothetical protein
MTSDKISSIICRFFIQEIYPYIFYWSLNDSPTGATLAALQLPYFVHGPMAGPCLPWCLQTNTPLSVTSFILKNTCLHGVRKKWFNFRRLFYPADRLTIGIKQSSIIRGLFIWNKYLPLFIDLLMIAPVALEKNAPLVARLLDLRKNLHIYCDIIKILFLTSLIC